MSWTESAGHGKLSGQSALPAWCSPLPLTALMLAEWIVTLALEDPGVRRLRRRALVGPCTGRLVAEGRRTDANWFPAVPANTYLERIVTVEGRRVIPLGGVANANVVGCNETGYYNHWRTDEFGFANPAGALASRGPHLFFIGDSYTQGDCLQPEETTAAACGPPGPTR